MSMFANIALLGGGVRVRVWITEQRKIKRRSKALYTKPLMANLDITLEGFCSQFVPLLWLHITTQQEDVVQGVPQQGLCITPIGRAQLDTCLLQTHIVMPPCGLVHTVYVCALSIGYMHNTNFMHILLCCFNMFCLTVYLYKSISSKLSANFFFFFYISC